MAWEQALPVPLSTPRAIDAPRDLGKGPWYRILAEREAGRVEVW
jgi:hypothetical protein